VWRHSLVALGSRDEVERRTKRNEGFAFYAGLELPDESGEVGHDPGVQVGVFDGFTFLRIDQQVGLGDEGERREGH
jgi:hypothetical protein